MSGIGRILVPADFSSCSKDALARAVGLSERYFGATINVLHVWEQPPHTSSRPPVLETDNGAAPAPLRALQDMEAFLAEHEAKGVVSFKRLHESGNPANVILEVANRGHYDLIVMGTHGRTGMARGYLGSIAENVVRHAPCPVMTVREQPSERAQAVASAGVASANGTARSAK